VKRALVIALAGCYAPHAQPGAPCTPDDPVCPGDQTCAPVAGGYACVDMVAADARTDAAGKVDAHGAADAHGDAPVALQWSLVQTKDSMGATLSFAPTGAGHLIVVAVEPTNTNTVTAITDDAGNAYVPVPNARATETADTLGIELWYAKNSKPGATTITPQASPLYGSVMWEVANIRTTNPLDIATTLDDGPSTNAPTGAAITTSVTGELVVSVTIVAHQVTTPANTAFTTDHRTFGNGWAHLTDPAAPPGTYQAHWDQSNPGGFCASSAAFFVQ
jgi:hypothetical protein